MLEKNNGTDPIVQHAGILALANHSKPEELAMLSNSDSLTIKTAAIVALRRQNSKAVSKFLNDENNQIQLEAARAIGDEHIKTAMPNLANLYRALCQIPPPLLIMEEIHKQKCSLVLRELPKRPLNSKA